MRRLVSIFHSINCTIYIVCPDAEPEAVIQRNPLQERQSASHSDILAAKRG